MKMVLQIDKNYSLDIFCGSDSIIMLIITKYPVEISTTDIINISTISSLVIYEITMNPPLCHMGLAYNRESM
jgi:hypothetical protein